MNTAKQKPIYGYKGQIAVTSGGCRRDKIGGGEREAQIIMCKISKPREYMTQGISSLFYNTFKWTII